MRSRRSVQGFLLDWSCEECVLFVGGALLINEKNTRQSLAKTTCWLKPNEPSLHVQAHKLSKVQTRLVTQTRNTTHERTHLALTALPPVLGAERAAAALPAVAALPPVLAERAAAALLAPGALPPVLADAAAATLLAAVAPPPVLADAAAAAQLARISSTPVLADSAAAALLA